MALVRRPGLGRSSCCRDRRGAARARGGAAVEPVKALLFDVFGTVVDWRSGVIRDVTALAAEQGADIDAAWFADRWRAAYRPAMNQVRTGELPWTNLDGLHRRTLAPLVAGPGRG